MTTKNIILSQLSEVKETSDIKEIAQLLNSGNWIAVCATTEEKPNFVLGKLAEYPRFFQGSK